MNARIWLVVSLTAVLLVPSTVSPPLPACCPAPPSGKAVVNADQTVIIIWDAATKTEHFIRQASFKSDASDFGFLIPTPTQPDLNESGNEAFSHLLKVTEPERRKIPRPSAGMSCGCALPPKAALQPDVRVLDEKQVAGFNAVVLEADSSSALVDWLKGHGYSYSPEIEAWAKPYVDSGWKITALKVAKDKEGEGQLEIAASALRMSFKTDRPLFPYREPDYMDSTAALGASRRLLRIYFLAEARYQGELSKDVQWTGQVAWANKLSAADGTKTLQLLNLPEASGPEQWWLTEFEDEWPYRVAKDDLYFSRGDNQEIIKREPIEEYVSSPDLQQEMAYSIIAIVVALTLQRRVRRRVLAR